MAKVFFFTTNRSFVASKTNFYLQQHVIKIFTANYIE